jgi:integration host factor subunit beta
VNEKTLSNAIAKQFFLTKIESKEIIQLILAQALESLKRNERIYFRGFGAFTKEKRSAKKVRHPKTGKIITIPENITVDFNPSTRLIQKIK